MVFEELTTGKIEEMCSWLEFYDENGYLPFETKKMSITVSGNIYSKLGKILNKSMIINKILERHL